MIKALNFLFNYLFLASVILLLQVLLYEIYVITDFNMVSSGDSKLELLIGETLTFIFFVSLYNIPICGISGIVLLVKKKRIKLGILCLSAAIIYCMYLWQMGDSL